MTEPRPFGRTGETAARVWHEHADGTVAAGQWKGLIVTPADLERRGGDRVRTAAAALGRPFDFFLALDLRAGDLKIGWPMHALLKFRGEKLGRHILIDASDVLDAEWIAAHAGVQGVVIDYAPHDMAARYRVFTAAQVGGVALIGRADTAEAAALQLGTPPFSATLLADGVTAPPPLSSEATDALWSTYAATHAEPVKLRGAHPPDEG